MRKKTDKEKIKELYWNVLNNIAECDHLLDKGIASLSTLHFKQAMIELRTYRTSKDILKRILERKLNEL